MQRLVKLAKPPILVQNEDQWTADYLAAVAAGDATRAERWRHKDIKATLREEVRSKCAYCEGYVEDVTYPHVEHVIPKAVRPDLAHRWHNLTSACSRCNVAKSDFYDDTTGLLDPYADDLDAHLRFLGSLILWGLGSVRGELTIRKLTLNRLGLADARAKRLESVREVLERWHGANDPIREALAEALRLDAREGEFSGSVSAFLLSFGFPLERPA